MTTKCKKPAKLKMGTIVEIEGFNQAKTINSLTALGVNFSKIELASNNLLRLHFANKYKKSVLEYLQNYGAKYSIISSQTLLTLLSWATTRLSLIISGLIFTCLIALSEGFVWRIEVKGNEYLSDKVIKDMLKSSDVGIGSFKKNIDIFSLEQSLRTAESIADIDINFDGTTLVCSVMEKLRPHEENQGKVKEVVSCYDAIITRVTCDSGTAKVSVGDKVFAGDTLISHEKYDSEGKVIGTVATKGSVLGTTTFYKSEYLTSSVITAKRTGRKHVQSDLNIFGGVIKGSGCDYEFFETEKSNYLTSDGLFFPFWVERTTYYEVDLVEEKVDIDERAENLKRELLLDIFVDTRCEVISEKVLLTDMGDGKKVEIFVNVNLEIGDWS